MTIPLILLAMPSLLVGWLGFPPEKGPFHKFLEPVFATDPAKERARSGRAYAVNDGSQAALSSNQDATSTAEAATTDESHATAEEGRAPHFETTKMIFGIISTMVALPASSSPI